MYHKAQWRCNGSAIRLQCFYISILASYCTYISHTHMHTHTHTFIHPHSHIICNEGVKYCQRLFVLLCMHISMQTFFLFYIQSDWYYCGIKFYQDKFLSFFYRNDAFLRSLKSISFASVYYVFIRYAVIIFYCNF